MVKVKFGLSRTIKTDDFENVKIEMHVEEECEKDVVGETFKDIRKFVRKKLKEEEERWN